MKTYLRHRIHNAMDVKVERIADEFMAASIVSKGEDGQSFEDTRDLKKSVKTGGCGECQTSCQSACKTSCGVANQQCEKCMSEK